MPRRSQASGWVCWELVLSFEDCRRVRSGCSRVPASGVVGPAEPVGVAGPLLDAGVGLAEVQSGYWACGPAIRPRTLRRLVCSICVLTPCYQEHQFALLLLGHSSSSRSWTRSKLFQLGLFDGETATGSLNSILLTQSQDYFTSIGKGETAAFFIVSL